MKPLTPIDPFAPLSITKAVRRDFEEKLKSESSAILRWMIEGCLDVQKHGLQRPHAVRTATAEYFDEQDLCGQWIEECCDAEPGNHHKWELVRDLFGSWSKHAERAGENAGSKKAFSEE